MTSKLVWQKQNSLDQLFDMTDYVLHVSSGTLGVGTHRLWFSGGKLKSCENSCLFCVCFVFLIRMFGILKNVADEMEWVGECVRAKADIKWARHFCT